MNKEDIFSVPLALPYSAINANGRVKADWLLNVFQDVASQQCSQLGISGFEMAEKHLKWVVAQYRIQIHGKFVYNMPLTLRTWRNPWRNLYEVRQFAIFSSPPSKDAAPLVTATGIWILIKAASGKPVRLSPHIPPHLMESPADRPPHLEKPVPMEEFHHEINFPVRFLDLDLNQHVNNRVYLRWAVESLPEPYCFEYAPCNCTVVYKKEGLFGDQILSRIRLSFKGRAGNHSLKTDHSIIKKGSGDELARLIIEWEKIPPANLFQDGHLL